ncbi:MAG: hypothetical protein JXB04_00695, partial [Kiritimatiellae bacterium]|nr:hypothetical protein [Kiritimatiellia bacterium]
NRANISALELPDEKLALGTVELVLDGKATLDSLALTDARLRSDFLTLDASGTYGGEAGTFSAKASGDLAKTSLLLTRMNVLPGDMKLAGTFQADLSGTSRGNQVVIEKNEAVLSDFVFSQAGKTFREARVTLTQKGTLDVKKETAALSPIDLHTSFGTVQLSQLDVVGWSKPIPDVKAAGRATLDLGRAAQSAGDFAGLPDGMSVAGQTAAGFSAALAAGTPASFSLESQTTGLRIKSKDAPEIVEEKVTLAAKATVSEDLAVVTIEKLDLAASPFSMTAQASFRQEGEDRSASAKGSLAFDLDRLTPYVQAFAGTNITMTGKGSKPFELATSWKGRNVADALKNANGSAAFRAESIKGFGMHVTSLDVPLEVKSGAATVDLRAQVNQGTLAAKPSADLGADKPVLTLPPKSTILGGLRLTPELADKTFGLIHPIFKGATSAGGTVSLHMENFSWPLSAEAKNEAVFAGKAEFKQVHLASSGMLISLLQAMKAREREVTILSTNVSFSCRNGRIESSPLTLGVGKHQISIVGSVGLDQTLDYQAQVPVTEDLVGSHAAKYLSGTTVKIPIRGTASKPELNLGSLNAAVADLAGQAARKAVEEKASELIRGLFKQ